MSKYFMVCNGCVYHTNNLYYRKHLRDFGVNRIVYYDAVNGAYLFTGVRNVDGFCKHHELLHEGFYDLYSEEDVIW